MQFAPASPASTSESGSVLSGTAPPEGVVVAEAPAMYVNTETGAVYAKSNTGLNATGWMALIAEP